MIRKLAKKSFFLKRIVRTHRLKTKQPSWSKIIAKDKDLWDLALNNSRSEKKILMATSVGGHLGATTLSSMLSIALTLRGADVHILLCDSVLPACFGCWREWYSKEKIFAKHGPKENICKFCFPSAYKMFKSLGLTVHRYSDLVTEDQVLEAKILSSKIPFEKVDSYALDNIAIGEHVLAGALRFYARGDLEKQAYSRLILMRYFEAAITTYYVIKSLLTKEEFDASVSLHGIYVPPGIIGEVCRNQNVRVANWNPAYRKKTFIFSHGDTYHHTMISEPVDKWINLKWNDKLENQLISYLQSRWKGTDDWIWFNKEPQFGLDEISKTYGIDFTKPCIGLLTNVMWDAQLHYPSNVFSNMLEWVITTIGYFIKRPDLQLIIRIHPAELSGTLVSRQKVEDEIRKVYPNLPKNIIIIPPESGVSTYAVMPQCNSVIIYNTKTGVELSAMGMPVIIAGEAWIRNKGFAIDVKSRKDYVDILNKLPLKNKLTPEEQEKAKKYAYHFFFRRMIPIEFMEPAKGDPPYKVKIKSLEDLMPGKSKGLDIICEGILNGSDFIYPAESI